jgi:hypothetical protein
VAAAAAVLVTSAFALGWLPGSAAPKSVKKEISLLTRDVKRGILALQSPRGPHLLVSKTRLLASLVTRRGRFAVWVVPLADGERCTFLQQVGTRSLGTFGCTTHPQTLSPGGYSGEGITLIGGFAPPHTTSVEVRGAPGWGRNTLPVRRGFYFGRVPGPVAFAVVGRDAQGHVVARKSLLPHEAPPAPSIVPTDRTALELRTRKGEKITLIVGPGPGGTCVTWDAVDPLGGGSSCDPFPKHGLRGGIMQLGAAPHSTVFLEGETGPEVRAIRLRFEDGRTVPVKFGLRVFLYEVLPQNYVKGHRPQAVVGLDGSGHVVARQRLGPYAG